MGTPAEMFEALSRYPLGKQLFSRAVTLKAPYFASISPLFLELKPGRARVKVLKVRARSSKRSASSSALDPGPAAYDSRHG